MKKTILLTTCIISALFVGCGGNENKSTAESSHASETGGGSPSYDPKRGEGKYSLETLTLKDQLDAPLAESGEKISEVKCFSCHKVTDEKLVGPGWKGVTKRRTPPWIMNFITNPDPMIDKDPQAQAMLELCLVRMPNQNLTDEDARHILEFMRKNDGIK